VADEATADAPPRRRTSWSLKTIVEDVSGRPIADFQDPSRPVHPYVRAKLEHPPSLGGAGAPASGEPYDPVSHLYPPLVGAHGREFHGPEHEHHNETLERHPPAPPVGVGEKPRTAGPFHRPERLYLHYLLLHLDRLSDTALAYLRNAVEEEFAHRARPLLDRPAPGTTATDAPATAPPPTMAMPAR